MRYHEFVAASDKTLQKMRANQSGWRIEELFRVAEGNGVEWRRPRGGRSHVIFSAPGVREIVSVPAKRPIKPIYVRHLLVLIDAAREGRSR
jgi:hypothetical protein